MALKVITTEDGSQSLFNEQMNETYHSTKGARSESEYVFIAQGLNNLSTQNKSISILEVGFGMGLNAWLTWIWAEERNVSVHFLTLEPNSIPNETLSQLDILANAQFKKIHDAKWKQSVQLSNQFTIEKLPLRLENFDRVQFADCIFFDAFAPNKQPDIWRIENLSICFNALKTGGILTTYCAQGKFKRNLKKVGFQMEVLPGALGKKEMVRGIKSL